MNRFELVSPVMAVMVMGIGCLTLWGWILDIPALKSVFPGLISMKANTAICFILAGVSLVLQARPQPTPAALRRRVAQVLALGVSCIGFLVLCEWLFDWDLGIDQLLFQDVREPIPLSAPGRMASSTALNFTLLGLALFFLDTPTRRNRWPAQYLTLAVVPITLVAFIGYFYGIGNLHQVSPYASVALHTIVGFLLLSAGILLARPDHGVTGLLLGATPGGIMVRRMLLPGVLVTVLFGGLAVWAERAGLIGFGFDTALLVTALIALFVGLMWWAARALDRLDLERQRGVEATQEANARLRQRTAMLESAQANLRTSEARLRTVVENLMEGVVVSDLEGNLLHWNRAALEMHGLSAVERGWGRLRDLAEQFELSAMDGTVWPMEQRPLMRILRGEVLRECEARIRRRQGDWRRIFSYGGGLVRDEEGAPFMAVMTVSDITERKRAEEALRQSVERQKVAEAVAIERQRFYDVLETLPAMICLLTPDYHVAFANRSFRQRFGESHGRRCYEYCFGRGEPCDFCETYNVLKTGQPHRWEVKGPDGTVIEAHDFPFTDADGSPMILEMDIDITEFRKTQAALKEANERLEQRVAERTAALRESAERARIAQQAARWGVFDFNYITGKNYWSPEIEALYGLQPGEFERTYEGWRKRLHPEDRVEAEREMERALKKGEYAQDFRVIWPDESIHWLFARAKVFRDEHGRPVRMLGVNVDITERKEAEEGLRRLKDELELRIEQRTAELQAANRELNDFASIVSHDLKAPLRGVAALADWLQQDNAAQLDDQGRQRLVQMDRRIARMNRMIEEILQYSRLGRTAEKPEPVPLGKLLPMIVQDLAPPPSAHIHLGSDLPVVQGEAVRLRQVFQNLIANAIKYADKPTVEIQVTWTDADSCWKFAVADNGPGIAEEHFERIFKMFQTLAPKDKTDSTGVGLALVKRIVERAGGRVWVESRLGQGSTFRFTWPKAPQTRQVETPESIAA